MIYIYEKYATYNMSVLMYIYIYILYFGHMYDGYTCTYLFYDVSWTHICCCLFEVVFTCNLFCRVRVPCVSCSGVACY